MRHYIKHTNMFACFDHCSICNLSSRWLAFGLLMRLMNLSDLSGGGGGGGGGGGRKKKKTMTTIIVYFRDHLVLMVVALSTDEWVVFNLQWYYNGGRE
jgi:hypothetical protein